MLKFLENYFIVKKFRKNCKNIFNFKSIDQNESQILIEFNSFNSFHISASYLSNYLKKKYNCKLYAFFNYSILSSEINFSFLNKIKWVIGNFLSIKNFGTYKCLNVDKIFKPNPKNDDYEKSIKTFNKIKKNLKKKKDVLRIKIDGILIGDLIYDTYLKKFYEPTLIFDDKFYKILKDFLVLFYFWRSYFRDNKVRSIITGHFVYSYGLIVRIALKKKIECYNVTLMRIFKGTNENPTFDGRAFKFKKIINNTPKRILKNGLRSSKKILNKRIKHGKILGSDIPYVSKSSFRSTNKDDLINNNKTKKVLICMHDFFDAAHINRNNLFNDFSDWLEFLGKLSNKTNYDWYIKTHPFYEGKFKFYQSISFKTMENIVKKYNKIKILPNTYNHNQLVKNGIDLVLTVYGTVAMEYAYLNTKVITACKNNLFSEFNFNIHPTSIKDYERKILNFEKIKLIISKKEIYKYYYARHLHHDTSWLAPNYEKFIKKLGYNNQFTPKIYSMWEAYFKEEHTKRIFNTIDKFYKSKDNFLNIYHSKNYLKFLK